MKKYKVKKGDSLYKIAQNVYGAKSGWKWRFIYFKNRKIVSNPNKIQVGMILEV